MATTILREKKQQIGREFFAPTLITLDSLCFRRYTLASFHSF
jgi:hypothetical protein